MTNSSLESKNEVDSLGWQWDNSYTQLPEVLFQRVQPSEFKHPEVLILNEPLAQSMGLSLAGLSSETAAAIFAGQMIPSGSDPIAQAYAGHQYGGFTVLGDGRAILLGEHLGPDGQRFDIQFKGSGRTLYSRRGDGLAVVGPMLREYIISEAMFALGVPTTQSLAVVATGVPVMRERMLPGAVLTRVAASHIRVGTFQFLAAHRNWDVLKELADYTIKRHFSEAVAASEETNCYLAMLQEVVRRQAELIAQWQRIGFVHGVMNTDNMVVCGETIDYGPCAFMDRYHPDTVFSSIDDYGRYAYRNQPKIAQWNLARFAETLLTLIDADQETAVAKAMEVLNAFPDQFEQAWLDGMRKKLGLRAAEPGDRELVESLLQWMEQTEADFTNTFRALAHEPVPDDPRFASEPFQHWHQLWQARRQRETASAESQRELMRSVNPYVIPRNHLVEAALAAAQDNQDLAPLNALLAALTQPFTERPESQFLTDPPPPDGCHYRTFCGT